MAGSSSRAGERSFMHRTIELSMHPVDWASFPGQAIALISFIIIIVSGVVSNAGEVAYALSQHHYWFHGPGE